MTPAAKSAATAGAEAVVPEKLLNEGEVVILAVKPSPWFVLLYSWPTLAMAVLVVAAAYLAESLLAVDVRPDLFLMAASAVAAVQVFIACCQWVGRLYVLTNIRVMRVRGVFKVDLFQCPLKKIENIVQSATVQERFFSVGSLFFQAPECPKDEPGWIHLARPAEVYEVVRDAVARSRG